MLRIGFDIGGTTIKAGLVDDEMRIKDKRVLPTPKGDAEALCGLIVRTAEDMLNGEKPEVLGVTVPGSVSSEGGILDAWNIGLRNVPLKAMLEERFAAGKVIVKNDADAAAAAELEIGALKGVETGLMLTLGTGVGGSIVFCGKLFKGGLGRGTELGHAMLDRGGRLCGCGHRGCIETLCSATALKRLAETACNERDGMIYCRAEAGEEIGAKLAIECAMAGDERAKAIFEDYTDALSDAIASFVNVLDPQMIVIGGGVSGAGDFLLDILRKKVPPRTFFGSCGSFSTAKAGNDAGVLGSVL